ncbi:flagellar brake protein [Halanaerobium sp. DL-01]|uniref:flagellar brake protein n=2 Tax=unclassified Halanaerobium TaxID=2641197 RepID=UPI000DF26799|nr:PilZ domain-containing protein [Halanaerobium sp. DL-01]
MKLPEINQKLEIEILTGLYKGKYLSKVADIKKGGILITGLYREGASLPVRINQDIEVYFTTERAAYKFKSRVKKRLKEPFPLLYIEKPENIIRIQRRDYFRLEVSGQITIYSQEEEKLMEARLLDISGGGIKIEVDEHFDKGQKIKVELKNILKEKELISASVVRSHKKDHKSWELGIKFEDIEENLREEIIQWIFAYQRENRKKGLS